MTNTAAEDLKDELEAAGVGTFAAETGWSLRVGKEPAKPNRTVTLYDTGGPEPNPKFLLEEPRVLARVRGEPDDYPGASAKALEVRDALLGSPRKTINGTVYVGIWADSDPSLLEYDEESRPIFVVNFRTVREPASGTHRQSL